jgi:MFS transporter, AAHS family, 4-hydroxybenzoate transporter
MEINVGEEIGNAPLGTYHYFLAFLVSSIVFFEGYDTFNASYVIHYVMQPWHLAAGQAGLLVSSGIIGFTVSALLQGKLSDRMGRRPTVLAALWIATIFSFATAVLANSFLTFFLCRFATGLGLGVLLPVSVTYMNEFSPRRLKSTFATWGWGFGFSLGGVAASAVGVFLTPKLGWQSLYYVASLSVVLAVVCHWCLPESPQFKALRGDNAGTGLILARLNPSGTARYLSKEAVFVLPEPSAQKASLSLLLSARYRRTTLAVWGAAFFVLFAIYGLTGWVPTAMLERGESFSASFGFGAVILAMNFVGTLACSWFIDRQGMGRAALVLWWIGGALAAGVLAFANGHTLNLVSMILSGFFILGGQGGLNNLTAMWFETEVRGTAVGMMLGVGRLGGVLGPYATGFLQQIHPGSAVLFLAIGVASLLGAICIGCAGATPVASPAATVRS